MYVYVIIKIPAGRRRHDGLLCIHIYFSITRPSLDDMANSNV